MDVLQLCVWYSNTCDNRANAWGLNAFSVYRNFVTCFSFVSSRRKKSLEQGQFVYPQTATVGYEHKSLLQLPSTHGQNSRNYALFFSHDDIHLYLNSFIVLDVLGQMVKPNRSGKFCCCWHIPLIWDMVLCALALTWGKWAVCLVWVFFVLKPSKTYMWAR